MSFSLSRASDTEEIAALIATLRVTQERLELLTHGEVDTVTDATGQTFFLRKAQEELRRHALIQQAAILNALPAHIALLDAAGIIISVNETWRAFGTANGMNDPSFGAGADYLAICDEATGIDSHEGALVAAGLRALLRGEIPSFSIEYSCHSPSQQRWFLMTATPLSQGARGTVVMHLDVTERKKAEEVLLESEERFSGAFEFAPIGVALVSPVGSRFLRANRALCELLGYTEEELQSRTVQEITHPDDLEISLQNVHRAIDGGTRTHQLEKRYIRKDGQVIDAQLSISLVRDAHGEPLYFVGHILDITARKRAEEELRSSNERFHQLADNITDAFWVRSPDMQALHYISPAFERIWGRSVDVLYASPQEWLSYIVPEDRERVEAGFLDATRETATVDLEYRIVRPDGKIRWIQSRGWQVRDDSAALVSIIGIVTDITDRKRVAEELEIERGRLIFAQQVAKVGSWETDLTTMAVQWSEETYRIFETDPRLPVTHEDFLALVHPDDREALNAAFVESFEGRGPHSAEHRLLLPDGRIKFVEERWQIVFGANGVAVSALGTCQDISERRQSEIALRQSQRRLRDIIDGLGPSMFVGLLTPDGILLEANRSPLDPEETRPLEVIGQHFAETVWWSRLPEVQQQLRDAITRAAGGEPSRFDVRALSAAGKAIDIDFSLQPLRDESGRVVFLVPSSIVITARKQAEAALRRAQKLEAVGQLAAGVAHEFNNILQTLMSMATITRMRGVNPEIVRIAGEMEEQIRRGASVTQQLLVASRHQELTKTQLDLRDQLRNAYDLLRRLIPENINLVVEVPDEPALMDGDEGQIQQVLLNLAINARDAMPDGGTLTLRAASFGEEVALDVEDDGTGFDDSKREHLFEPFFTTKEPGKGTGLGLAVVHGIVEQHGGRVEVRSQPGSGSLFRVILPRSSHEPVPAKTPVAPEFAAASGRILLVEDEEGVREGVTTLLEIFGYDVIAVSRGEDALALPLTPVPDLLLSDVSLPGIGGPALAKFLRSRWPSLKVTLMTGYLDAATREAAQREGWDVLQKPFEMNDLSRHLASVMHAPVGAGDGL